jgi:glycosyltransferase involved in cell wall biosynthesis
MPAVYRLGDVYCLPSQGPGETWGLAINEAMASGKAIIASDKVGCAVDLVQEGVNGYIFKSNNQQDLLDKLILMSNSKEQLAIMGKKSFDLIQAWSFENQVEAIIKTIN